LRERSQELADRSRELRARVADLKRRVERPPASDDRER